MNGTAHTAAESPEMNFEKNNHGRPGLLLDIAEESYDGDGLSHANFDVDHSLAASEIQGRHSSVFD